MKKLFGFFLFLSISSFLSAGLMIDKPTITLGQSFTISHIADEVITGISIRHIQDSAIPSGLITDVTVSDTFGGFSGPTINMDTIISDRNSLDLQQGLLIEYNPFFPGHVAVGETVFTITIQTSDTVDAGTYTINFVEGSWKNSSNVATDLGSIDYTIVPEPATLVLLVVGGRFIKRRS